jgi:hypothetical protein
MPIPPCNISPNLIIRLRILQDLHIQIHHTNPLARTPQLTQRPDKRHSNLTQPRIPHTRRAPRIRKHNRTRILKRTRREHGIQEERFSSGIACKARGATVVVRPEGGYDDYLGAAGDELAEGFGEGEVPAD